MDLGKVVETFDVAYDEVFDRGDAAGCAAFLTEDVLSMARDQPMMRGGDAFEQADRTPMAQSRGGTDTNSSIEFGEDEILYRVGTFAISGTTPSEQGSF